MGKHPEERLWVSSHLSYGQALTLVDEDLNNTARLQKGPWPLWAVVTSTISPDSKLVDHHPAQTWSCAIAEHLWLLSWTSSYTHTDRYGRHSRRDSDRQEPTGCTIPPAATLRLLVGYMCLTALGILIDNSYLSLLIFSFPFFIIAAIESSIWSIFALIQFWSLFAFNTATYLKLNLWHFSVVCFLIWLK